MAALPAPIRRAVAALLRETDRAAISEDDLRMALREMLSPDSHYGPQTPIDYHTPRKPSERMSALMADRSVRRRMADLMAEGVDQGGHLFYDTRPMRAMWREVADEPSFDEFVAVNAALSPQSNTESQIKRAIPVFGAHRRGEGVPQAWELPEGYRHFLYGTSQRRLAARALSGEGLNPRTGAKTASFYENLRGNLHPEVATIDKHATALPAIMSGDPRWLKHAGEPVQYQGDDFVPRRAFESGEIDIDDALEQPNWWGGKPLDSEYRAFVKYYGDLGQKVGLTNPAAAQAAAWRGGAHITGVDSPADPIVVQFANRVMELARKHGLSFREALAGVARGDPTLLSIAAGAPVLLGLLAEEAPEMAGV